MNSTIPPWKYHVFSSFRGEDTRKGLTDHLHAALKQKGIITFLDDKLNGGEVISDQLLQAIDESLISLVVLTRSYVSSRWCFDELKRILDSKRFWVEKSSQSPIRFIHLMCVIKEVPLLMPFNRMLRDLLETKRSCKDGKTP
ncbi:TMV resistance protein N-like [Neltuma alba]|uniref:TMV resistance protein N-like n=1 Tax=Neltuma alba TaxID=207710 RepID=UPI0010A2DEB9|nr:TMV resistance protein N-like [Prosopis alba]